MSCAQGTARWEEARRAHVPCDGGLARGMQGLDFAGWAAAIESSVTANSQSFDTMVSEELGDSRRKAEVTQIGARPVPMPGN